MTGKTISHYNIVEELGRGGMGVVYKAEDTKLDRTVAIKVLPPHALISDDDRNRFYREARAAAAINHPNIAHVYEIDEVEGEGGATQPFIAMEYIDGETLGERIAKGPLPLKDALSIATQIAEGLKAAHAKDIVHRDVKSGNMMLTADGTVKILDFGLAKTSASTRLTQMGSTLGTVAYMSPEQAKGEEVDRRSDIWSLGVILYEMVAGKLPFHGDYEQAVVYGILNEDPESLTTLRAGVPMALDGVIAKMLAKDPDLRYQHVDELPADLKAIDISAASATTLISTRSGSRVAVAPPVSEIGVAPAAAPTPVRTKSPWLLIGVAALLAAGLTAAGFLLTKPAPPAKEVKRYYVSLDPAQSVLSPTLSADGQYLAFRSGSPPSIFIKDPDQFEVRALEGTEGAAGWHPFSPDNRWILFRTDGDTWKRILSSGEGRPVDVGKIEGANFGGTWLGNEAVVISSNKGLVRFDLATGARSMMTEADSGTIHIIPSQIEESGPVMFSSFTPASADSSYVAVVDPASGEVSVVIEGATVGALAGTDHILYSRSAALPLTLLAVPFDRKTLRLKGTSVPVLEGNDYVTSTWSRDGKLVLAGAAPTNVRRMLWVDRSGRETPFTETEDYIDRVRISPDGDRVAVAIADEADTDVDLWIYDVDGVGISQLTFEHRNENHAWMPGGEYLAFESDRQGATSTIWYQKADGSEPAAMLIEIDKHLHPWSFSPDGLLLADELDASRITLLSPVDGSEQVYLDTPSAAEDAPVFSPDGKWIAYVSNELGAAEVFVAQFPFEGGKWRISTDGGGLPVWAPDGKAVYYWSAGRLMQADVQTTPSFRRVGSPQMLFEKRGVIEYDIHPDGDRFLIIQRKLGELEGGTRVRVVENWFEELKQLAPVGD